MTRSITVRTGIGAFDFLVGRWTVANRRLREPLSGRTEWDEFPGTIVCHAPLFDGAANLDEITFPTLGSRGLTLRLFDPQREEWSLNWVSSRTGTLSPPVVGRFAPDGTGAFVGDDILDGRRVRCRFLWSGISATTARWEQAYSTDGAGWETNWIMDMTRVGSAS